MDVKALVVFLALSLLASACSDNGVGADGGDGGGPDASSDRGPLVDVGPTSGVSCATAIDVSAGGTFSGSTLNAPNQYQTCNVGGVGVGARVYVIHSPTTQRFKVRAAPAATTPTYTNLSLAVKRDCAQQFVCLDESLIHVTGAAPGTVQVVFDLQTNDTVFVFVTGWLNSDPANAQGDYTLTVLPDNGTGPSGDDCSSAIDVSAGGSWGSSTTSATNDYQGGSGCTVQQSGPDRVYALTTQQAVTYDILLDTFSGGTSDLAIFVMGDCGSQSCVPVTQRGYPGGRFTTTPGMVYFIVVKGQMNPGTNYILHVNPNPT